MKIKIEFMSRLYFLIQEFLLRCFRPDCIMAMQEIEDI